MTSWIAQWPFVFVVDSHHSSIGWALVNARIVTPTRQEQLAELRRGGFRFVGMSSDGTFPLAEEADPLDYGVLCEAWCHCFREPERYLPPHLPSATISASDFTDYQQVSPQVVWGNNISMPDFDFIYVGATEPWKKAAKNWDLARRCIPRICGELRLRCLLIGTPTADLPPSSHLVFEPLLP